MKDNLLRHIDLWLKMLLKYFDKNKCRGVLFFSLLGISLMIWAGIIGYYTGLAIYEVILSSIK